MEVDWNDVTSSSRWRDESEHKNWKPMDCHSVGYLIVRNGREIRLALSYGQDMDEPTLEPIATLVKVIPRGCITGLRVIRR